MNNRHDFNPQQPLDSRHSNYEEILQYIEQNTSRDHKSEILEFLANLHQEQAGTSLFSDIKPKKFYEYLNLCVENIEAYLKGGEYRVQIFPQNLNGSYPFPYRTVIVINDEIPFVIDSLEEYFNEIDALQYSVYESVNSKLDDDNKLISLQVDQNHSFKFAVFFLKEELQKSNQKIQSELESIFRQIHLATEDFDPMKSEIEAAIQKYRPEGTDNLPNLVDRNEIRDFLEFLRNENFVFLGAERFEFQENKTHDELQNRIANQSDLGICKDEEMDFDVKQLIKTTKNNKDNQNHQNQVNIFKHNMRSKIYRRERLDVVEIRTPTKKEDVDNILILFGLFTNRTLAQPPVSIPFLKHKFNKILHQEEIEEHTHQYRDLYSVYNEFPKELLFIFSSEKLLEDIKLFNAARVERELKLRIREHPRVNGIYVTISMSRQSFSGKIRQAIETELKKTFDPPTIDHQLSIDESKVAQVYFYLEAPAPITKIDTDKLENKIQDMTQSWTDSLQESIEETFEDEKHDVAPIYQDIFPDDYRAMVDPELALNDIANLELLRNNEQDPPLMDLVNPSEDNFTHLILYSDEKLLLNEVMPLLSNHGFSVTEQATFEINLDKTHYYLHLFQLLDREGEPLPLENRKKLILRSLQSVFDGMQRDDLLNSLVASEGLSPSELNLFRLYKNHLHQIKLPVKLESINRTLVSYVDVTRELLNYFDTKFNPEYSYSKEKRKTKIKSILENLRKKISNVNERTSYKILIALLNLMKSTTRTHFYQDQDQNPLILDGIPKNKYVEGKTHISIKINCFQVESMPLPRPEFEIFVYSPLMEAVHLRSGKIARGGIRWSDRRDDFRTEILSLMKTQKIKNALIVPEGAKGGFVLKEEYLPEEKSIQQHAKEQYSVFMQAMLDITDNRIDGEIVPPENVIRYDSDDPYLVVAADKGTAEFSDLANRISRAYDFWMDDAYASGGSVGYDHKELGITAKGAWKCVKRHFRGIGKDITQEAFSVVGIGDMGGDVFGNGMILSQNIKLVAAFNHRKIFLDPNPNPEESFKERKRLFHADKSGWENYDRSKISKGGGVFDRTANMIEFEPEAQNLLNLDKSEITPDEAIQALLCADVHLLWNGGIGTYIKSSDESHTDVEDPQNDPFRVDADQVQASVIGEGGNLGITQQGRIELDRNGVRLNTDFIDNSGGVDLSDHEVNLKILLQQIIKNGSLDQKNREKYLMNLSSEFEQQVISNNYRQSGVISLENLDSQKRIDDYRNLMDYLENSVNLNRAVENLPDERELLDRKLAGEGLTRPELAVLLSYTKMDLYRKSLDKSWPESTVLSPMFHDYFPDNVTDDYPEAPQKHPLSKEIAMTNLVNYAVDSAGITFFHRLEEELGVGLIEILKTYYTADYLAQGEKIREGIFDKNGSVSAQLQYEAWATVIDRLAHAVTWFVNTINESLVFKGFQRDMKQGLDDHFETVLNHLQERQLEYYQENKSYWEDRGFNGEIANRIADLSYLVPVLETLILNRDYEHKDISEIAGIYFKLGNTLHVDWIISKIFENTSTNRWDEFAFRTLAVEVHNLQKQLLKRMISEDESLDKFKKRNADTINRLNEIQNTIKKESVERFSAFQYMIQRIRSLL